MDEVAIEAVTGRPHRGVWREASGGVSRGSAVVLPGMGYTCAHPLLHYATKVLRTAGFDVLEVWFDYRDVDLAGLAPAALDDVALCDGEAALAALDARGVDGPRVAVGKSLGTRHLAALSLAGRLTDVATVWFTPLITREVVYHALAQRDYPTLVIAGTHDPATPHAVLAQLEAQVDAAVELVRLEGADHALERADPREAVDVLGDVVSALAGFVARLEVTPAWRESP